MITTDFLSTVTKKQAIHSMYCLTFGLLGLNNGKQNNLLIGELQDYFGGGSQISLFYNARSALYQYLIALKLNKKTEVILSGYNCVSVSNAIIQAGYTPIYTDIEDERLGIDIEVLKNNITEQTGVIILQHSFGIPARDTKEIIKLAQEKGIIIIEDVAHALGAEIDEVKLGTLGDAAIFSTGRDKVISSVNGAFLIENTDISIVNTQLIQVPTTLVIKNHLYNILGFLAFKTYSLKLGKIIMFISRKFKLFPDIVSINEFSSNEINLYYKLPDSLAFLLRKEFEKLQFYTTIRKKHAEIYQKGGMKKGLLFITGNGFRCAYLCTNKKEREKLYLFMRANNVLLGITWSGNNIIPNKADLNKAGYKIGSCPISEDIASRLLFLPNAYNRSKNEIEKVNKLLDKFYSENV